MVGYEWIYNILTFIKFYCRLSMCKICLIHSCLNYSKKKLFEININHLINMNINQVNYEIKKL